LLSIASVSRKSDNVQGAQMRLFKVVGSANAVLNIARGSLKFTPIEELNDPSELTPVFDRHEVQRSLKALREKGMAQNQFRWLLRQDAILDLLSPEQKVLSAPRSRREANRMLSISTFDNLDFMEAKLSATIRDIRERVGILSLSLRYDSLPMWAHYANLARGFVVVFDDLKRSFVGDETGSLNVPKPVTYADRFAGMTFDPATQDRLFFSKLSDWSYERERRVVTALSRCRQAANSTLHLKDVDPSHVKAIICGWRVTPEDRLLLGRELNK
jgi:Protein of unknown function (DUF2971)